MRIFVTLTLGSQLAKFPPIPLKIMTLVRLRDTSGLIVIKVVFALFHG